MAGTVEGGKLAAKKNLERDPDFYKKIGARGGKVKGVKGFAAMSPEKHHAASVKGGLVKGEDYKTKLDTPEQEFKLPAYQTKKKRLALWGR